MMRRIYFDHNATTPMAESVRQAMNQWAGLPLNPSSVHADGRQARALVEQARQRILATLGIHADTIALKEAVQSGMYHDYRVVFTGSCTEANNIVLQAMRDRDLALSTVEHVSVLRVAERFWPQNVMTESGFARAKLIYLPVMQNGALNLAQAARLFEANFGMANGGVRSDEGFAPGDKAWLCSVMLVNNETGVVQPVRELADLVHSYGGLLHSDISQALGKIPVDFANLGVDAVTFSPHKFGGPLGVGVLVFNQRAFLDAACELTPLLWGGGQEYGLRSGTHNVLAIHGAGVACSNLSERVNEMRGRVREMRDFLRNNLLNITPQACVFAATAPRVDNTLSLTMPGRKAELQVIAFDAHGVSLSAGAACSSGKIGRPYVHKAMGYSDELAEAALRISLGPENTWDELEYFIELWRKFGNSVVY